ncbi:hypothetical protein ABIC84_004994 [Mucilaginibacter sp. 3215]
MLTEGIIRILPARLTPRSRDAINEVDPLASLKFAARFKDDNSGDLAQVVFYQSKCLYSLFLCKIS